MWIDTINPNHQFFMFNVKNESNAINWAMETAKLKTMNTIDSWQTRSPCKRFTNIFLGDLAKNLFKQFLISQFPQFQPVIIEYDVIRQDNFTKHDLFDLAIKTKDGQKNIEVKSSGEKYSQSINKMLDRRIIINMDNIHQHFEWVAAQIMFIPENLQFFDNANFQCDNFDLFATQYVNSFYNQNIKAYICGYATLEMQMSALAQRNVFNVDGNWLNQGSQQASRNYANILIKDAKKPIEILNEINSVL